MQPREVLRPKAGQYRISQSLRICHRFAFHPSFLQRCSARMANAGAEGRAEWSISPTIQYPARIRLFGVEHAAGAAGILERIVWCPTLWQALRRLAQTHHV